MRFTSPQVLEVTDFPSSTLDHGNIPMLYPLPPILLSQTLPSKPFATEGQLFATEGAGTRLPQSHSACETKIPYMRGQWE